MDSLERPLLRLHVLVCLPAGHLLPVLLLHVSGGVGSRTASTVAGGGMGSGCNAVHFGWALQQLACSDYPAGHLLPARLPPGDVAVTVTVTGWLTCGGAQMGGGGGGAGGGGGGSQ